MNRLSQGLSGLVCYVGLEHPCVEPPVPAPGLFGLEPQAVSGQDRVSYCTS